MNWIGNHSSGKSSFINYVLQRKIQVTGVAPTDDCFTIIVPGPADVDRDGPAFVGDPGKFENSTCKLWKKMVLFRC